MSTKACRIERMDLAPYTTFEITKNESPLASYLRDATDYIYSLGETEEGIARISVAALRGALNIVNLTDEEKENLKKDIKSAEEAGDNYVWYLVWAEDLIDYYQKQTAKRIVESTNYESKSM